MDREVVKVTLETLAEVDREAWDERVCSVPEGAFRQSVGMAVVRTRAYNEVPHFIRVEENGLTLGQLLILETIPYQRRLLRGSSRLIIAPIARRLLRRVQWGHGPLIFDRERAGLVFERLVETALERVAPGALEVQATLPVHGSIELAAAFHPIMEKHGFVGREWATVLIDLRMDPEERWKELSKGSRYDVRRARRDGVEVSEIGGQEELEEYFGVVCEAARRNKVVPALFEAVAEPWRYRNGRYKNSIFLARHEGRIVAGLQVQTFNGVMEQGSVVTSNYGNKQRLFGMHQLVWHLIELGHGREWRCLDLAGVNPDAEGKSSKDAGIFFFKTRWGGKIVTYRTYSKSLSSFKRSIFNMARKVKRD